MFTRILLYLFVLMDLTVFYIFYQEWVSWMLLVAGLGLPWLSLLVSLPAMVKTRLELELPPKLPLGTAAHVRIRIGCGLPQPPVKTRIRLTRLTTGESWLQNPGDRLPTDHCGGLLAQPARARMFDYLGLFRIKPRHTGSSVMLVLPQKIPLTTPPDLDKFLARSQQPKSGGGFSENHELRLYHPGDSLNQVHWKLSTKTRKLIIREPLLPQRGLVLVTMDISGSPDALDRKFGNLLWLGEYFLDRGIPFQIRVMTAQGLENLPVANQEELEKALEILLRSGPAKSSVQEHPSFASWQYHLGGDGDEA